MTAVRLSVCQAANCHNVYRFFGVRSSRNGMKEREVERERETERISTYRSMNA